MSFVLLLCDIIPFLQYETEQTVKIDKKKIKDKKKETQNLHENLNKEKTTKKRSIILKIEYKIEVL